MTSKSQKQAERELLNDLTYRLESIAPQLWELRKVETSPEEINEYGRTVDAMYERIYATQLEGCEFRVSCDESIPEYYLIVDDERGQRLNSFKGGFLFNRSIRALYKTIKANYEVSKRMQELKEREQKAKRIEQALQARQEQLA
jgi:hypothetical protein